LSSGNERINVYFSKEDQLTVENISQKAIAPMINVYDGFGKVLVSSKINFNGTSEKIQILIPPSYQGLLVVKAVYNKKHSEDFKLIKFR
jgi:hypothetical protein